MVGFVDDVTWITQKVMGHLDASWPGSWLLSTAHKIMVNCKKENKIKEAVWVFRGTNIQTSTECKQHMRALIGTEENKKNYINDKISEWTKETNMLTDIATTYPSSLHSLCH